MLVSKNYDKKVSLKNFSLKLYVIIIIRKAIKLIIKLVKKRTIVKTIFILMITILKL